MWVFMSFFCVRSGLLQLGVLLVSIFTHAFFYSGAWIIEPTGSSIGALSSTFTSPNDLQENHAISHIDRSGAWIIDPNTIIDR